MNIKCPTCNSEVDISSDYCTKCKSEMPNPTKSFVYDQLFELMKAENEARLHLDSKAGTYIGLLGISATVFGALGSLLTLDNIKLLKTLEFNYVLLLYIFYLLTILLFLFGVLFAFKAFHMGSPRIDNPDDDKKMKELIELKKVYTKMQSDTMLDLLNKQSKTTKDHLIIQLIKIIRVNRYLNVKKSNLILYAYISTIVAIIFLLITSVYISIISINILR